mmetsp:Transcript_1190/g.3738  ORF Transcript_1190/g.3738 Transcript_1190/m.3738 type:complete len:233 (-) Transcript_1190:501-1199(-)
MHRRCTLPLPCRRDLGAPGRRSSAAPPHRARPIWQRAPGPRSGVPHSYLRAQRQRAGPRRCHQSRALAVLTQLWFLLSPSLRPRWSRGQPGASCFYAPNHTRSRLESRGRGGRLQQSKEDEEGGRVDSVDPHVYHPRALPPKDSQQGSGMGQQPAPLEVCRTGGPAQRPGPQESRWTLFCQRGHIDCDCCADARLGIERGRSRGPRPIPPPHRVSPHCQAIRPGANSGKRRD